MGDRVRAGDAVLNILQREGVRYVFGIVGSAFLEILDALYDRSDLQFVSVRHEQAAALMADGYARVSGRPAVCLVTSGPGATNLATGLAQAYVAHSPVIAMVGGPPDQYYGRGAFQELNLVDSFRPITKFAAVVNRADRIPELLRHAFRVATSGRKGPVYLEIPRNYLQDQVLVDEPLEVGRYRAEEQAAGCDPELVARAARMLEQARRPVLLCGGGTLWGGAGKPVVQLAERLGAGLTTSYGHNDAVPDAHPLYLGALGRAGSGEAAEAIRQADVLLAIGSRFSQFTTFYDTRYISTATRVIQVDIEPSEIGRNHPLALGMVGDARQAAEQVTARLGAHSADQNLRAEWTAYVGGLAQRRRARLSDCLAWDDEPIKPQRIYAELARAAPPGTIYTLDAGAAVAMGYDHLQLTGPRTLVSPLDLGALGVGFPQALGAKLARPDSAVVSLNGDGGFLFNAQELQTAADYGINVVAIVMSNGEWGSEKAYQTHLYQGRYVGADIRSPRYDHLAELFGVRGVYCERPAQIHSALEEALGSAKASVIEIAIDPEELPYPPGISSKALPST